MALRFFFLQVLLFCLLPYHAISETYRHECPNGNYIVFKPDTGVYLSDPTNQETQIFQGTIGAFLSSDVSTPGWVNNYWAGNQKVTNKTTIFATVNKFYMVNQEGEIFQFPLKNSSYYVLSGRFPRFINIIYKAGGYEFEVIGVQRSDKKTVEYYVMREDGESAFIREFSNPDFKVPLGVEDSEFSKILPPPKPKRKPILVPSENGGKPVDARDVVARFFRDLSAEVSTATGLFTDEQDPNDLDWLRRHLAKKQAGGAMVTGESGAGKTELIKAFVRKVIEGKFPEIPVTTEFILVDRSMLGAGTRYTGMFESRVNALIQYAKQPGVVLVLDEAHSLRGAGTHESNPNDLFEMLKPHLADGSIKAIGTTTDEEYAAHFSPDEALARRLPVLKKKPIPPEKLPRAINSWATKRGYTPLSEKILAEVLRISREFDPIGTDLVKAIRLTEDVLVDLIINSIESSACTIEHVHAAAHRLYEVNLAEFNPKYRQELIRNLKAILEARIAGLSQVKELLYNLTLRSTTGVHDKAKPRGRLAFIGPKGLAKTYVAEEYAKAMGVPFVRINMSTYATGEETNNLLRELGMAIRKHPFSVILFDEVEKASPYVQNVLLSVMDSDSMTMTETIPGTSHRRFTKLRTTTATMLFASNAGQDFLLGKGGELPETEFKKAVVGGGFSEFLLDRMHRVIPFFPPNNINEFTMVIEMKLKEMLKKNSQQTDREILLADDEKINIIYHIAKKHFRKNGVSFRPALEDLDELIGNEIARKLSEPEAPGPGSTLSIEPCSFLLAKS